MSVARYLCLIAVLFISLASLTGQTGLRAQAQSEPAAGAVAQRALLDKYCVTCHNERLKTAGLVLQNLDVAQPSTNAETWERVIRKVRSGGMPPMSAPRPDTASLTGLVTWLETSVDRSAAAAPNPGRPVVHRLNRAEYANAIRDLLELDIDARALLPPDDSSYGFDNVADVLSVTSGLLDRYLIVARRVSRLAIGEPSLRQAKQIYQVPLALLQTERMGEDQPFGSRGGFSMRHYFPADGEYEIRIKLQRNALNLAWAIRGLDLDNVLDVRVDSQQVKQFVIKQDPNRSPSNVAGSGYENDYAAREAEAPLVFRLPVKAGMRVVGVMFPRRHWYVEGVGPSQLPPVSFAFESGLNSGEPFGRIDMGVERIEIGGPFDAKTPTDTSSRRRIFICQPTPSTEESCAGTILSNLARRAYRRPLTAQDVQRLMAFYEEGRGEGGFEDGIERGLQRILVSPYFLLRKEENQQKATPGSAYRVSDIELASRLSFFLWSSIPDEELLTLAAAGKLKDDAVLERQVRRMLRDPRASALVSNFFGQWLHLRNMRSHRPDTNIYPEFDENLRDAFRRETELFLESQLQEDHSVTELLTANYTFVNERLAKHYGIPDVYGSHFRRVTLPADSPRAGLLGQGSILTITSYPDRTSPVVRGKWLLENLIGAPPPPPPPNVPPFPKNQSGTAPKSVRERMEQHRKNPACALCHNRIDPLGFALENFDAVGQYRSTEEGAAIDTSGTLPDGTKFSGPADFREALLSQREELVTNLTEKLLTYGLGRGVAYYDMPAVRHIVREAARGNYRWSSLVLSIVKSVPFQMRSAES